MIILNNGSSFNISDVSITVPQNSSIPITIDNVLLFRNSNILCSAIISGRLLVGEDDYTYDDPSLAIGAIFGGILIKNLTNVEVDIDDVGISISPGVIYRYSYLERLKFSNNILTALNQNQVVFNNGVRDLQLVEALQLIHGVSSVVTGMLTTDTNTNFTLPVSYDVYRNKNLSIDLSSIYLTTLQLNTADWLKFTPPLCDERTGYTAILKGTIIGYSFTCTANTSTTLLVYINDIPQELCVISSGILVSTNYSKNIDFNLGDKLRFRAGTANAKNVSLSIVYKWRI